jgi:hypothetical protein
VHILPSPGPGHPGRIVLLGFYMTTYTFQPPTTRPSSAMLTVCFFAGGADFPRPRPSVSSYLPVAPRVRR